jgi:hypothetical protein
LNELAAAGTRLVAAEVKVAYRPSSLRPGSSLLSLAGAPVAVELSRVVVDAALTGAGTATTATESAVVVAVTRTHLVRVAHMCCVYQAK